MAQNKTADNSLFMELSPSGKAKVCKTFIPRSNRGSSSIQGYSQGERHRILIPTFAGSNPAIPAKRKERGRWKMKDEKSWIIIPLIIVIGAILSWGIVCGFIQLIALCFDISISLRVSTGIWLGLWLLSWVFKSHKDKKIKSEVR